MRKVNLELIVGSFVLVAVACLVYLTVLVGRVDVLGGTEHELQAIFSNVGGLKVGSTVFIAGVPVGRVKRITLDDYRASVVVGIVGDIEIQEDAIATVKTRGMLGETFVEITPGGSDVVLKPGERIRETEPALDLYSMISKYVFSDKAGGDLK